MQKLIKQKQKKSRENLLRSRNKNVKRARGKTY